MTFLCKTPKGTKTTWLEWKAAIFLAWLEMICPNLGLLHSQPTDPKKDLPTLPFGMKDAKFENYKSKKYDPLW